MFFSSLAKYPEFLDHMVFLFSIFWETSILFSIVASPSYISLILILLSKIRKTKGKDKWITTFGKYVLGIFCQRHEVDIELYLSESMITKLLLLLFIGNEMSKLKSHLKTIRTNETFKAVALWRIEISNVFLYYSYNQIEIFMNKTTFS